MSRFQVEISTVKLVANSKDMVKLLKGWPAHFRPGSLPEGSREPDR